MAATPSLVFICGYIKYRVLLIWKQRSQSAAMKCFTAKDSLKAIFILLPGNPGKAELYFDFLDQLYHNYDKAVDIYAFNYLGHHIPSSTTYVLQDQIEYCRQEILKIKRDYPKNEIYLFGHSLGAFIALKLESLANKVILLFPAIDDLKSTQNAKEMWLLFTRLGIFMVACFTYIISFLPMAFKYQLVHWVEPKTTHDQNVVLARNWDYRIIYNTIGLTRDEFKVISPLDISIFKRSISNNKCLINKCWFFFSPFDGWCDITTFRKMAENWPELVVTRENIHQFENGGIYLTDAEVPHAFILGYGHKVASLIHDIVPCEIE